jgi:CubicO group peptidase (beta-lactamase class C family)
VTEILAERPDINGVCPPQFEAVFDAFAANFAPDKDASEIGARFTAIMDGEVLVDLWGGHADRARTRPFDDRTLCPVFSSTKGIAALLIARLAGEGRLDYAQTVASVWPEFAQAGKGAITVEQAMSHQAGLVNLREGFDPALWFDWDAMCALVAGAEPLWAPGTASGYHPGTYGILAGEIFRRVDGRTMSQALQEDVCGPLDIEFWIGLPEGQDDRLAQMQRPSAMPDLGTLNEPRRLAFFKPWSAAPHKDEARWRGLQLPSASGHATGLALATLHQAFACDGEIEGRTVLEPGVAAACARARITGPDMVLPFTVSWGAGVLRNQPLGIYGPGQHSFGHSGWGGSCGFADPERRLSAAYVMNRQSPHLIGDPRSRRLIDALYASL